MKESLEEKINKYLNELASGDKIKINSETENLGGPKVSKEKMVKKGTYEVVEVWEKGILIRNGDERYFIPKNADFNEI